MRSKANGSFSQIRGPLDVPGTPVPPTVPTQPRPLVAVLNPEKTTCEESFSRSKSLAQTRKSIDSVGEVNQESAQVSWWSSPSKVDGVARNGAVVIDVALPKSCDVPMSSLV